MSLLDTELSHDVNEEVMLFSAPVVCVVGLLVVSVPLFTSSHATVIAPIATTAAAPAAAAR
ncbi:hypothetical protein ACORG1_04560 [Mycobacterium sp. TJFP1]